MNPMKKVFLHLFRDVQSVSGHHSRLFFSLLHRSLLSNEKLTAQSKEVAVCGGQLSDRLGEGHVLGFLSRFRCENSADSGSRMQGGNGNEIKERKERVRVCERPKSTSNQTQTLPFFRPAWFIIHNEWR